MSILAILSGIASSIAGFFKLRSSPNVQRREAEKDVRSRESEMELKKKEIRNAVYANDDRKLNEIASRLLSSLAAAAILFGCASKPDREIVYIPTDRRIESCTNSLGMACKAVPNSVFCELLEKAQELKDLKTELKVDKRLNP